MIIQDLIKSITSTYSMKALIVVYAVFSNGNDKRLLFKEYSCVEQSGVPGISV